MSRKIPRRDFVIGAAAAGLGGVLPRALRAAESGAAGVAAQGDAAPAVIVRRARPVVVASANGNLHRNGGPETCVARAFRLMTGGTDVLDALIAGVNIVELDPADTSVGYGGLPNGDGVVQLDASLMHGPTRRAGAVASLEGVRTPSLVAKAVLDNTDHHLLVGPGAQAFARQMGFEIEADLNTDVSRQRWLEWKRRVDPARWLDPRQRADAAHQAGLSMVRDGLIDAEHYYGTINCNGVTATGDVAGITTTSGLAWKIPGRVGDSPILGAGLYVDNDVGAAGSTGRGEANLYGLCSFVIVENMRRGMSPVDAGLDALRRVRTNTVEQRLLNDRGLPSFGLNFYIINARGDHAGVSMYPARYAVCTENGAETLATVALLEGRP
jgi:N4-(beta-N-acetylglucosaminyl)-L-asparaginase